MLLRVAAISLFGSVPGWRTPFEARANSESLARSGMTALPSSPAKYAVRDASLPPIARRALLEMAEQ
jgi:hypothetical protein